MSRFARRSTLWVAAIIASATVLLACLAWLGGGARDNRQSLILEAFGQEARTLRGDVTEQFRRHLRALRENQPEHIRAYHEQRAVTTRHLNRLVQRQGTGEWLAGVSEQLDAWDATAERLFAAQSAGQDLPEREAIALLTRQGNQVLAMLVLLDQQWSDRAAELRASGRSARRRAGWLAGAAVLATLATALSGLLWVRAHRRPAGRITRR